MYRRRILGSVTAVTALSALAGCSSPRGSNAEQNGESGSATTVEPSARQSTTSEPSPDGTTTVEPPTPSVGESVEVDGETLAVEAVVVQDSAVVQGFDERYVRSPSESKLVFVRIAHPGTEMGVDEWRLAVDGVTTRPAVDGETTRTWIGGARRRVGAVDDSPTWIPFERRVVDDPPTTTIRYVGGSTGVQWRVGSDVAEELATPEPSFEVRDVRHPSSVESGQRFEVEIDVESTRDSVFRAALNYGPRLGSRTIVRPVSEGRTTVEVDGTFETGDFERQAMAFRLVYPNGSTTFEVTVDDE